MSKCSAWPPIPRRRALNDPSAVRLSGSTLVIAVDLAEETVDYRWHETAPEMRRS